MLREKIIYHMAGWEELEYDVLDSIDELPDKAPQDFEEWNEAQLETYIQTEHRLVVLIDGWVVDVTNYIKDHPGGVCHLEKSHIFPQTPPGEQYKQGSSGGCNPGF
ncbi:stearoyl-CoA desaturase (delta-9 desaturase) [Ceratobasidium sp. AG-Ba]|nr:stearoyl-CoA desaturase (delta-9 desaturase) [Ceratobasidium sp. AG-Ba]